MARKITCNCPDFSRRYAANPTGRSPWTQSGHDWTDSNVSLNPPGFCKYIYAALIAEKIEFNVPKDYPTPPLDEIKDKYSKKATYNLYGDTFN